MSNLSLQVIPETSPELPAPAQDDLLNAEMSTAQEFQTGTGDTLGPVFILHTFKLLNCSHLSLRGE